MKYLLLSIIIVISLCTPVHSQSLMKDWWDVKDSVYTVKVGINPYNVNFRSFAEIDFSLFEWNITDKNNKLFNMRGFESSNLLKTLINVPDELTSETALKIVINSLNSYKIRKKPDASLKWILDFSSSTTTKYDNVMQIRTMPLNFVSFEEWSIMYSYALLVDGNKLNSIYDTEKNCKDIIGYDIQEYYKVLPSNTSIILYNPTEMYLFQQPVFKFSTKVGSDILFFYQDRHGVYVCNERDEYAWLYVNDLCTSGAVLSYRSSSIRSMQIIQNRYILIQTKYSNSILYDIISSKLLTTDFFNIISLTDEKISVYNNQNDSSIEYSLSKIF